MHKRDMTLTFYRGYAINIGESGIHWKHEEQLRTQDSHSEANFILGPLLLIIDVFLGPYGS